MKYVAGVDVGSTQTKAILLSFERDIVGRALLPTGANVSKSAENAFKELTKQNGLGKKDVVYVVGTGYGRFKVTFGDEQVTEIGCHARGAHFLFPETRTVIDMGGQDTKAIKVSPKGEVLDFCMNDKCAAGTGRFLTASADVMDLPLDDIGPLALKAKNPVKMTSVCAVFVESDIMSYLAQKKTVEDVLGGVHKAIAARVISLVRRVGIEEQLTFTGGVSRNIGMVKALEDALGARLNVSTDSHFIGAIGAALFGLDKVEIGKAQIQRPDLDKWVDDETNDTH